MEQLKPAEVAERLGISVKTLQRWDNEEILVAYRTPTDRRYYTEQQIKELIASRSRIDHDEASDLTVFYIFRGDISNHKLLDSLISDKAAQKKFGICYSKYKDAFLGATDNIEAFVKTAGLVLEDSDREEVTDEEYDKEIAIYQNSLVDYLECEWEGYDLTLDYGVGRNDTIEIPLNDHAENALDTIISFDWLLSVDDWYLDISNNTKMLIFNMIIANLRQSIKANLNTENTTEDTE